MPSVSAMLKAVTRAEAGPYVFAVALAVAYGLLPLLVHLLVVEGEYFVKLAMLAGVGAAAVIVGARLTAFDGLDRLPRVAMDLDRFLFAVWTAFLVFVLVACITADRIPFVAALQGADAETLAVLRERFLKARQGWQAVFPYVNAVLAGALIPYSLMVMLLRRHRLRWILFAVFFVYCISFVEKAFFLKAAMPLAYLVIQERVESALRPGMVLGAIVGALALVTVASGVGGVDEGPGDEPFFSTTFVPRGPAGFLVWRSVAIPVVTAADALRVFDEEYGGRPLLGASSSLLAGLFGLQRVNIEREIFAVQWGQNETETGNANSVYLTEAYLNFGYVGLVVFSLLVGLILRRFARSQDEALRSLWPLFCFTIFVAPLTGTLFSNGFLLVIMVSHLLLLETTPPAPEPAPNS